MVRRSHHVDHRGSAKTRRRRRERMVRAYGCRGVVNCHWCGVGMRKKTFTVDRLDPLGTYKWANVVPACETCNKGRRRTKVVRETEEVPF